MSRFVFDRLENPQGVTLLVLKIFGSLKKAQQLFFLKNKFNKLKNPPTFFQTCCDIVKGVCKVMGSVFGMEKIKEYNAKKNFFSKLNVSEYHFLT